MANLKKVIYLSNTDYETLVTTGTVTINGVTLTYDPDNVYITPEEVATTTVNGLMSSTDKTKLDAISSQTAYTSKGSATKVPQITTNSYGQVTGITEVTITQPTTTSQLTNNSNFVSGTGLDSNYIVVGNGNGTIKKGDYTISELKAIAEGKTDTYVIATKACITGTEDSSTGNFTNVSAILTAPSGGTSLDLTAMNVGDNIYVKETEVPDYWVSDKTGTGSSTRLTLSKLETTKVDLTGYAVKSHASNATTYGVGTTSNYGHVKLKTGDVSSETAKDGVAASSSHNHDNSYYPKTGNPSGFLTGITSSDVTTALGFTPYNATNPNNYTSNAGTVTGVTAGAGLNTTSNNTATDGGTISSSGTLYLTKSGVTAGTYQGITVDKYGRVTGASDQGYGTYSKPSGGIPASDLADSYLKLDGTTTMTGALQLQATGNNQSNIGSNGIRWNSTSLPEQTSPQYFCVIDGFANGGRQKWTSVANVKTALGVPTESTVSSWGFTKNAGTVKSVAAGTGLNISGTATVSPTVNVDSNYKLQTTQEWKNSSIYSVVSGITTTDGNASSGNYLSVKWTVDDVEGITEPYDGMKILVRIPLAGVGTAGVVLSIDGGTTYHPVAYNINTALTTHYPVNTNKVFVYNATQKMNGYLTSNTATSITGVWQGESNYDSNTTITYGTLAYYFRPYAAQAVYRYKLGMLDKDNRFVPLTTTNLSKTAYADYASSTTYAKDVVVHRNGKWYKSLAASNKGHTPESSSTWWTNVTDCTPTSLSFKPDKIYWYNTTTTISAGAVMGGNTLMTVGFNQPYMAYCNFNEGMLAYRMIYLCGTYNTTTGLFTLRDGGTAGSKLYYTTVPTNTANLTLSTYFASGYDYILVGGTYSSNNYLHLREDHPMYHFDGTNLVPYDTWQANQSGINLIDLT